MGTSATGLGTEGTLPRFAALDSFLSTTCVPTQIEQLICGQMRPGWVWSGICSNFTASQLDKLLMDKPSWELGYLFHHLYARLAVTNYGVK